MSSAFGRQGAIMTALRRFCGDHPSVDTLAAVAAVGFFALVRYLTNLPDPLLTMAVSERRDLYSWAAIVVSLLATLVTVSMSQALAPGSRMQQLVEEHSGDLSRAWAQMFSTSLVVVLISLGSLTLDARGRPSWASHLSTLAFVFAIAWVSARFLRASWLFTGLNAISLEDRRAQGGRPRKQIGNPK